MYAPFLNLDDEDTPAFQTACKKSQLFVNLYGGPTQTPSHAAEQLLKRQFQYTGGLFVVDERAGLPLAAAIRRGDLQLCDPPNPGCCRDGPSTGCYNLKILQYWCRRNDARTWTRDPSLEIDLPESKTWRGA